MSIFYEVQEFTIADGWINTWASPDNWAYYTTKEEAQADIDYHVNECQKAVIKGDMLDAPTLESYRIAEVSSSIALKGL